MKCDFCGDTKRESKEFGIPEGWTKNYTHNIVNCHRKKCWGKGIKKMCDIIKKEQINENKV